MSNHNAAHLLPLQLQLVANDVSLNNECQSRRGPFAEFVLFLNSAVGTVKCEVHSFEANAYGIPIR
jgi:hypothetical protein